jgi:hypothetical protein
MNDLHLGLQFVILTNFSKSVERNVYNSLRNTESGMIHRKSQLLILYENTRPQSFKLLSLNVMIYS